ncbi:hypothetical protein GGR54DRAFT_447780 [Hypoxylon sp. NC1633]|nr:hypothetical protein GGR54DRAFT_447780 [Hypoxylon sp. NC1633]
MPRPLRSSCDRCHSQKLKCPKEAGVPTCTRCLRAGTTCVFSPAGLSSRRTMLTPVHFDSDLNMQFDWPSLDLENALQTHPEVAQEFQLDATVRGFGQAEAVSQDPRSICVGQLAALAVEIDQVSLDLSSMLHVHLPKDRPIKDHHANFIHTITAQRSVEQLFTLAQRLTNIYPQALNVLFDKLEHPECQDPNCSHTAKLPSEVDQFFTTADDNQGEIDVFLFNLLVACHTKVLDVMGSVISCARTCIQITQASPEFDLLEPELHIPEVRVGSFVATDAAASTMQFALVIHIATVLLDFARKLGTQVLAATGHEGDSRERRLLKLQCELLEERAASRVELFEQVKAALIKIGLMK